MCLKTINGKFLCCDECKKTYLKSCIPKKYKEHIPEEHDDTFLCHQCYKEIENDEKDNFNLNEELIDQFDEKQETDNMQI